MSYSIKEKDSSELASEIYEAMIAPCEIPKQLIERFIADIVSSNVWSGLIENALDIVRAFPVEGEVYYTILNGLYLGDELMSNHDLEEKIGYSHPVYCKKKNQAIMLFGIAIWTELKKHWKNADEEIHRIMCKYGRLEECW